MIEPEIVFADLSDNAALAEALLKYTFAALLNERQEDLAFFDQRIERGLVAKLEGIVGSEFVHMDYGEAIHALERGEREVRVPGRVGHRPAVGVRALSDREIREKTVIVMNHPKTIKAFYMRLNVDGTVAAMDVLAPGIGDIIGGSQREERLEVLDRNMTERGIDKEHCAPTLPSPASGGGLGRGDLRRYGTVPHAGFGLAPVFARGTPSAAPASPMCTTRSPSRERRGVRGIDRGWTVVPSFAEADKRLSSAHEQASGTGNPSRAPVTCGRPG
jgi:asparaginyl-tRNA synthetase